MTTTSTQPLRRTTGASESCLGPKTSDDALAGDPLQAYCGTRVSEIVRRQPDDWNLDASPEYGTSPFPFKGKNRTSSRTVLIPPFL